MGGTKLTRESIVDDLESSADDLKRFGVKSIALIGSYARDEAEEGSDIDFLVEFAQGRGLFNDYAGLKNHLEDMFGKEVDIVKPHLIREELKPYILEGVAYEART